MTISGSSPGTKYAASNKRRSAYQKLVEAKDRTEFEMFLCSQNLPHWVDQWCRTYDPREPDPFIPLDPFPKQVKLLDWFAEREASRQNGLVVKSRDMGVTWFFVAYCVHGWLFREGFSAGIGSRKLELVDRRGDLNSIFEKARFLIDNLPAWMRPSGFKRTEHDNQGRLINPANGATITGEGGDNIGRGGRSSIYFIDEAAFLEHPDSVYRALSQTTNCLIDVSTPNGSGNRFAEKRFSGKVGVFEFHWRDDPRKDDAWYEEQKRKYDAVIVAGEIDMDFSASVEGVTIPAMWVRAAVGLKLPASKRTIAGLDIGEEGADLSVFTPRSGPVVHTPVSWGKCLTSETAARARDEAIASGAQAIIFDLGGPGLGVKGHWYPADVRDRLPFRPIGVMAGEKCGDLHWPDGRTSKELFFNRKAELWWLLRKRFERTYEHVNGIKVHPLEDLVSLPNHPTLISELSVQTHYRGEDGKIHMTPKEKLGCKSPDFADSLVLTEADAGDWTPTPPPRSYAEGRSPLAEVPRGAFREDRFDDDEDGPRGLRIPGDVFR